MSGAFEQADPPTEFLAPSRAADSDSKLECTSDDQEFRALVKRGAMLEIVTVGFYRFWLATDIRRHLWSHTFVGGDAFRYVGTPKELLLGFLFATALLAPIYFSSFLIGVEIETEYPFLSLAISLFFLGFWQFAIFRARRYRLHRTVWRGLRFGMSGSGVIYALLAMLWGALTLLTLGGALPWMQASLERYKMQNTVFGDLLGNFVGEPSDFFRKGWKTWLLTLLVILPFIIIPALSNSMSPIDIRSSIDGRPLTRDNPAALWIVVYIVLMFAAPIFGVYLYSAFKAIQWKWWLEGVRIGEVSASSSLAGAALTKNYWSFAGAMFGYSVLAIIAAIVAAVINGALGVIVSILAYVALGVQFIILWRVYMIQGVWKIVSETTTIHNIEAAQNAAQQVDANRPSALGEGFADSLDVAGF